MLPFGTGDVGGGRQRWDVWLAWSSGRHRGARLGPAVSAGLDSPTTDCGLAGARVGSSILVFGGDPPRTLGWQRHRAMSTTIAADGEVCKVAFAKADDEWVDFFG